MNFNRKMRDGTFVLSLTKTELRCLLNAQSLLETAARVTGDELHRKTSDQLKQSIDAFETEATAKD